MKVFLIGMPGSGKSKVGKRLGELLSHEFIDLDECIEQHERKEIVDIFKVSGETHFREIERNLLKAESTERSDFVMATGGGAPCFFDNMDFMNQQGITVFLDVPIAMIHERLLEKGTESRPLLKNKLEKELLEELQQKYNARLIFYNQACIALKQEYGSIDQRAKEIVVRLKTLEK